MFMQVTQELQLELKSSTHKQDVTRFNVEQLVGDDFL